MSRWRKSLSKEERDNILAPEYFIKVNGLTKFSLLHSKHTQVIKSVLESGRWNKGLECKFHGKEDIPYLDHGRIYKDGLGNCVFIYLPYIRYDKSLLDMTDDIRKWAEDNRLNIVMIRESWYHADAFVVIVTAKRYVMNDLTIKWDSPGFGKRMTDITHIARWNI